jgi:D-glycero-D-manno-heptose 1,7-bisphosphate phosphatase
LDGIYICPHHPDRGFEGERKELKIKCDCRKPEPGMLKKAADDFNIDLSQSWMVGDGKNDVKAGIVAGCKTALISEQKGICEGQDVTGDSLLACIRAILRGD